VRSGRDADDPVSDDADLLAGADVVADADEVGAGVAVVDDPARQRPAGDLQNDRVGSEAADALLDYDAVPHGEQWRAAGRRVIDALVDVTAGQILARQRK